MGIKILWASKFDAHAVFNTAGGLQLSSLGSDGQYFSVGGSWIALMQKHIRMIICLCWPVKGHVCKDAVVGKSSVVRAVIISRKLSNIDSWLL